MAVLLNPTQIRDWQSAKQDRLLPIVYLRGFAMSDGEIDDTTADPFNGFNLGSVVLRTGWSGQSARHIFESPVLRLMQPPYDYRLTFSDGICGLNADAKQELRDWRNFLDSSAGRDSPVPPMAVIAICRYYDIDSTLLGQGKRVGMHTYGWGVGRLVLDLLDATQASSVYIVAHSMGGLVARTFLQNVDVLQSQAGHPDQDFAVVDGLVASNPQLSIRQQDWQRARGAVRRFFSYGTPHNGITGQGGMGNALVGIVGSLTGFEIDNFSQTKIEGYLKTPYANSLNGSFKLEDTFCLVGTGSADYPVAGGFSRRLVGQRSDGLVEIDNAVIIAPTTAGDPDTTELGARAYVRRAHSGPYGMVNSEEGFGNLSRFLFGDVRIDGDLIIRDIGLPAALQQARDKAGPGQMTIRASYSFEVLLRVRGESWAMNERLVQDGAAIFRPYHEIFQDDDNLPAERPLTPQQQRLRPLRKNIGLFTAFLDTKLRMRQDKEAVAGALRDDAMGFAFRLRVAVPDYEVDGRFLRNDHYEGSYLLDRDWVFMAFRDDPDEWGLAYGLNLPGLDTKKLSAVMPAANDALAEDGNTPFRRLAGQPGAPLLEFWLPVEEQGPPHFSAWLRLRASMR